MVFERDLCAELRRMAEVGFGGMLSTGTLETAANEIERLRKRVRDLEEQKSPLDQYNNGYAKAQADIRSALGIET